MKLNEGSYSDEYNNKHISTQSELSGIYNSIIVLKQINMLLSGFEWSTSLFLGYLNLNNNIRLYKMA